MPSPTWSTVPTSERSVSTSYCSIRCFRIEVISSGRSFTNLSPGFCTSPVRRGLRAEPGFARREPRSHPSHAQPERGVSWGNHGFLHVALRDVASRRTLLVSGHEFTTKAVEPAAHAGVHAQRAGLEDHPADQVGVDRAARLDGAA